MQLETVHEIKGQVSVRNADCVLYLLHRYSASAKTIENHINLLHELCQYVGLLSLA